MSGNTDASDSEVNRDGIYVAKNGPDFLDVTLPQWEDMLQENLLKKNRRGTDPSPIRHGRVMPSLVGRMTLLARETPLPAVGVIGVVIGVGTGATFRPKF